MKLTHLVTMRATEYERVELTDHEFNQTWPPGDKSVARQLYDQLKAVEARIEDYEGQRRPPLTKKDCEALLGCIMAPDPGPELMSEPELQEVHDHWERFAKDENEMDAAWLAFNLGPLLDHAQMVTAQKDKAVAQVDALKTAASDGRLEAFTVSAILSDLARVGADSTEGDDKANGASV